MGRVCLLLAPLTVKQVRLDDLTGLSASKWGFVPDLDDLVHLSGPAQTKLGARFAEAMLTLIRAPKSLEPPLELGAVKVFADERHWGTQIVVAFRNVQGYLCASGRPWGFELIKDGIPTKVIYRVDLDGDKARLRCGCSGDELKAMELVYGFGVNPYCNITDGAERSLPAFGPLSLGQGK